MLSSRNLIFVFFLVFLNGCVEKKTVLKPINSLEDYELDLIKNGDVILKNGYGNLSKTIVSLLDEKISISHCGILYLENDSVFVIHSIAKEYSDLDGVQKISLSSFLNDTKPNSLFVLRLKKDENVRKKVLEKAIEYKNNKTPFDYQFNSDDDTKIYCSELIYQSILKSTGMTVMIEKNIQSKKILTFNSLLDTANFEIIIKK